MAKIRVNLSRTGVPNWILLDSSDSDTLDGKHYQDIKNDYQTQINSLRQDLTALAQHVERFLRKDVDDEVTARVKFNDISGRVVLPVGPNKYATT